MSKNLQIPWPIGIRLRSYILTGLIITSLVGISPLFEPKIQEVEADFEVFAEQNLEISGLSTIQGNTLLPVSRPFLASKKDLKENLILVDQIPVIVTAYSSTVCQTDEDPYITAAGTWVREGVVANNMLSFGTKIRIPEIYGDKIFIVEDRMHWTKGDYHVDIWFPSYWQALNFGAKRTYIEIVEI